MIKRLAATFLSLLLLMSLAACGHSSDKEQITIEQKTEENSGMEEIEDFSSYVNKDYLLNYENIVISDVTGLTLEGAEGGIVELVTENGGASVLEIWKSENVTLRGLTCGHEVERGKCNGSVLYAEDCKNLTIEDCQLYGCGTDGIPELIVGTLPDYGGQINAVYTSLNGQPEFVFEGWYRSSYTYLGDGRFYYYGSGGASETGQGSYRLSKDGTTLNSEEFYFTHASEDNTELKVYCNTTGNWDIAKSQESDMSIDAFWEIEPSIEVLPLTSFADYAVERGPEAPVQVHWTELWMNEDTDYEKFVVDDGKYSAHVMFRAKRTITDFELMQMTIEEVNEDGKVSYDLKPIYSLDRLTPKRPLVVSLTFPGDTPAYGISYVDESGDGMKHQFSVEVSGEDGTLLLREIN